MSRNFGMLVKWSPIIVACVCVCVKTPLSCASEMCGVAFPSPVSVDRGKVMPCPVQ